jgi:hypothetical protein
MRVAGKYEISEPDLLKLTYGGRAPFWIRVYQQFLQLRGRPLEDLTASQCGWLASLEERLPDAVASYERTGIPPNGFPPQELSP